MLNAKCVSYMPIMLTSIFSCFSCQTNDENQEIGKKLFDMSGLETEFVSFVKGLWWQGAKACF